ncbi:MAG: solute-binding protein [Nitrososphaeria archaeon]|nr:solute-binding protein [Nitrososphaeria archaeon]NIQ33380.1 solute-binding protein [Nitrososphaeria archaeon]
MVRILPKRGYILLLAGILIGFSIFSGISLFYSRRGTQTSIGDMPESIEIVFLYTSEKQGWIEEVTPGFEKWFHDRFGIQIHVELEVGGTYETLNLILHGSAKPTVWSPASNIWIPYINTKWRNLGYDEDIAVDWTSLVTSPLVIAGWKSFQERYDITAFRDLYRLAAEDVDLKYGHPDPLLSNGGVMATILEFSEAAGKKPEELIVDDFKNDAILNVVRTIEANAVAYGKSTGFFGAWAVDNGPFAINTFSVYENVVLDNSLKAQKKWRDPIIAVYPEQGTLLSDHPFVVINADWVGKWQKFAAGQYLLYLLKDEIQVISQKHGFRPANPSVPLDKDVFNIENGVSYKLPVPVLRPPSGEVLEALFEAWVKVRHPGV